MSQSYLQLDVSQLSPQQRQAAEVFAGGPLRDDEVVYFMVGRAPGPASEEAKAAGRAALEKIFRKIDEHGIREGIDPDEADAIIDAAVEAERRRNR